MAVDDPFKLQLYEQNWKKATIDSVFPLAGKKCEGTPPNASETYTHDWNNTNGEVFRFGDVVNYTCVPDHFFSDGSTLRYNNDSLTDG